MNNPQVLEIIENLKGRRNYEEKKASKLGFNSLYAYIENKIFKDKKVESMVISVVLVESQIGLLMLGSYDRSKYLGDEDTTFIEYIRDVLEKKLSK